MGAKHSPAREQFPEAALHIQRIYTLTILVRVVQQIPAETRGLKGLGCGLGMSLHIPPLLEVFQDRLYWGAIRRCTG